MLDKCHCCGHETNCEKHRIIPGLRYGGKYTPENIILVCKQCHHRIHQILRRNKPTEYKHFLIAVATVQSGGEKLKLEQKLELVRKLDSEMITEFLKSRKERRDESD